MEKQVFKIQDEIEDDYSNDDLFNITSWGADLSFREIISMYEEGELLKPELQRKYVWDRNEASRFIESILMGLPVPSIFLAQVGKKKLIVDGYQRIMTIYEYVNEGVFSKDGKSFRLTSSEKINERWRGKTYSELSEDDKITIRSTTIHAIIFEQKKPQNDTSLYQIFERINTSGRTLKPQEIRNCIYQGTFNDLLFDLNKDINWRKLFGNVIEDTRMTDIEYILRFFALSDKDFPNIKVSQISLKKYLNEYMGQYKEMEIDLQEKMKQKFKNCMKYIKENIGENAFHSASLKKTEKYVDRFHPTIFDAVSIATYIYIFKNGDNKVFNLQEKHFELVNDELFKDYSSNRTTNMVNIKGRIQLAYKYLYGMDLVL